MNQQTIEEIVRATVEQLTKVKPIADTKREQERQENYALLYKKNARYLKKQLNQQNESYRKNSTKAL